MHWWEILKKKWRWKGGRHVFWWWISAEWTAVGWTLSGTGLGRLPWPLHHYEGLHLCRKVSFPPTSRPRPNSSPKEAPGCFLSDTGRKAGMIFNLKTLYFSLLDDKLTWPSNLKEKRAMLDPSHRESIWVLGSVDSGPGLRLQHVL